MLRRGLAGQNDRITELPPSPTLPMLLTELRSELVSQYSGPHHNTVCSETTSLKQMLHKLVFFPLSFWPARHLEKVENKNGLGMKNNI